jgi:maltokinase
VRPAPALGDWVATTPASALLPSRHRREADRVHGPLHLVDAFDLGPFVVAVVADEDGTHYPAPLVRADDGWRRAAEGDGASAALAAAPTDLVDAGDFSWSRWESADPGLGAERAVEADQTNESVVVDDRLVVKWTVRSDLGPEPAPSRLRALAAAGFEQTPRPHAILTWRGALVATVVAYLPGARDGWAWAVDDVRALCRDEIGLDAAVAPAAELGDLTARMHHALRHQTAAPKPAGADRAAAWTHRALAELSEAVLLVGGDEGELLHQLEPAARQVIEQLASAADTPVTDVHGDLHVGQVLRWRPPGSAAAAYSVTDFDGNPVLSADDRVAPAPAAVDVAGLLQSLDHVGRVVVHRTPGVDTELVARWTTLAQRSLVAAYREVDDASVHRLLDERLLRPLRVRQVVREHLYAVRHLPHWRYVPHAALPALLAADPER